MCGLVYGFRKDNYPISKSILKRYNHQKTRGSQGFGYISIKDGRVDKVERAMYSNTMEGYLKKEDSNEVLFHHRMPTSTPNTIETTHPIVVSNKKLDRDYYVLHNGVLSNYKELKDKFEGMGFIYTTEVETQERTVQKATKKILGESVTEFYNDSESMAIDLALYLDGKKDTIESDGTIAFICLATDKKGNIDKVYYGHNVGNPLKVEDNNDLFFIKSEGHGVDVEEDMLYEIDPTTRNIVKTEVKIGTYAPKMGYKLPDTTTQNWGRYGGRSPQSYEDQSTLPYFDSHNPYAHLDEDSYLKSDERYQDLFEELEDLKADIQDYSRRIDVAVADNDTPAWEELEACLEFAYERKRQIESDMDYLEDMLDSVSHLYSIK